MSNKLKKKKPDHKEMHQDSVFKEAWENMNEDMSKIMPGFIARRMQKKQGKLWVMVVVTLFELAILGVIGKLAYDWFTG